MAISELEPNQREELKGFWDNAVSPEYEQFQDINSDYIVGNMVEPGYFGNFSENGHVILEVHGNMGHPGFYENLNKRLEKSEENFSPYAIDTNHYSPSVEQYVEELNDAYQLLKSETDMESFSVVAHSLGCVGALKWIHENDHYAEIDKFVPSAGPFKGVAAADLAEQVERPIDMMESSTKIMASLNPFINSSSVEDFFDVYRFSDVSDSFVSRKSAEEGELAELMDNTRITEEAEVYTVRSSIDKWYIPLENTLPRELEHLSSFTSWENKIDSPEIEDAEGNLVLPSSTHHEAIEGDIAVEYIGRVLEEYQTEN